MVMTLRQFFVGDRVWTKRPGKNKLGEVIETDPVTGMFTIKYEDGEVEESCHFDDESIKKLPRKPDTAPQN